MAIPIPDWLKLIAEYVMAIPILDWLKLIAEYVMALPIPDWLKLIAEYVMAIPILDWLKPLIAEYVKAIPILDWLKQLIQLDYVWNYEDKVKKLDEAATKLQHEKERVHDTAREDEDRYGRAIYDHVEDWLCKVDGIISRHEKFKEDSRHEKAHPLGLSNLVIRYDLSKRAQEIKANVDEMLQKEKHDNINILSRWRGPLSMGFPLAEVDYVDFNSRSKTLEKIMEKLKDPSARMIGVYGFSGVGKTTLVTEAANRALKGGLFDVVTMANVTQSPDIKMIQGQIADMLGIKLEEESEYGRAARIKERLKREKKNILIILDDLFAKVDLNMLGISLQGDDGSRKNPILKEGKFSTARNEKTAERTPAGSSEIENTSAGPCESNIQETPAADSSESKIQETSASSSKVTEECENWCKVLLISEVKQVLTRMDVKANLIFSVGLLEDKESDTLFRKMAGIDNNKSPELEKLATKIVKKCEDLPMSIVTIARAVKNQTLLVWKETNQKLEGQNVTGTIECSTKLNYELLECEELKSIFLLCARMSHDALVADLVKYCIGLGFLQGIYTVRDARGRVQMSLAKLRQSGLLSDSYSSDRFTMQNLVRDAALSISSQENHVFTLTGGKLDEWPDVDKLKRCTAICLRHCDVIEKFPQSIKCPRLRVFQVENNGPQLEIPDKFFQGMKELRVLILTGFSLSQLPSSIGCLTKLRMLCLEQCKIGKQQLCIIGKLTNLRILSFSGSDIESLPDQLKYLSKLQIFDISNCSKLSTIPANVISSLTSLEELYMRNTQWWVEEGQNFSLSELGHLNQLTNLDLQIPSVANLPNDLFFDKLYIYKIVIGSSSIYLEPDFKIPESYELSRFLAIREKDGFDIHSQKGIKMMFDRVEDLLLEKLIRVQDVFYALNLKGFPCLNHLSIVSNSSIKYLINPKVPRKNKPEEAFTKLKSLHLHKLKKMEQICFCKLSLTSFAELKVIKIKLCHELKSVFLDSMAENLISLETVEVSECNSLKEIVVMQTPNANESLKFPKLRSLMLQSLSDFVGFYPTSPAEEPVKGTKILFHEKIEVSEIEIMELSFIPINQIWDEKSSFGNLIHLDVKGCGNLKYLLLFSVAENLKKLQRLFVSECDQMKYIFSQEQGSNAKDKNSIPPKLKNIKLSSMRCLSKIWNSEVPIDPIDNLDTLIIEECHKLVSVFACDTVGIFQSLGSLTVKNCKSMKAIYDLADEKQDARYKTELQDIHLETLPKLEHVLKRKKDQEDVLDLNNIRKIWLQDCQRLENIFPSSVNKTFENLEYLVAGGCSRLREIVAKGEEANNNQTSSIIKFEFPELTTVKFFELPKFRSFYPGDCKLSVPKLNDLSVEDCDKLIKPFTEENENSHGIFPDEVINQLKSIQVELRDAKSSTSYDHRWDNLEELHLSGLRNTEILYSFLYHNPNLKSLWLNSCSFGALMPLKRLAEIESLGVVPKLKNLNLTNLFWLNEIGFERDIIFQRIESLILKNCPLLGTISSSSLFLSHLTSLEVVDCDRLKSLMSPSTAKSLVQLNTMKVINCVSLEDIVSMQVREEENTSKFDINFSQLKALELVSLENLESFCRSKNCAFEFPSLDKFVVSACPKLEIFSEESKSTVLQKVYTVHEKENRWCWEGNLEDTIQYMFKKKKFFEGMVELSVSDHPELEEVWQRKEGPLKDWFYFYSLKTLKLKGCKFENYAIPSNVLGPLKSLQELEVGGCSNITFIFEMNDIKIRETPLGLKKLTLRWLPNVTHVWQQEQEDKQGILSFKNLQQVSVMDCDNLQTLLPAALARDLKMLEKLEVRNCTELPQIVGKEEEAADGTENVFVFPRLTSLVLYSLRKLTCFYSQSSLPKAHLMAVECPELGYLDVRSCPNLELFQSQQESDRKDQGCSYTKVISKVEKLYLSWKDASVWLGQSTDQDLQYLSELDLGLRDYEKENLTLASEILEKTPNLEKMEIRDCSSVKEISLEGMLGHLKRLELCHLDGLHSIRVLEYLPKLHQLRVSYCPRLTTLVQPSAAKMLADLEEMYVGDCESMKEIVGKGQDETTVDEIKFERLEMISLIDLSRLECFYSGNATLQLPSLIQVDISECPEMKSFSEGLRHVEPAPRLIQVSYDLFDKTELVLPHDLNVVVRWLPVIELKDLVLGDYPALKGMWLGEVQIPLDCLFRNLNSLVVEGCEFLSNAILPSHLLPFLSNLRMLEVRKCDSVKTIFDVKDLQNQPKGRISLPGLQEVIVSGCKSIESLFPASFAKDNLQKLDVRNCAELEEIVAKDDETATEEASKKVAVFPNVTSLTLWDLPKLRCICLGMSILHWPELENLNVYDCPMLTIFATNSLSSPDSYLEEGEDHFTSEKHGIVSAQKIPPNLERLSLGKEYVIMIEQGLVPHVDLLLQNIKFLTLQGFDKDSDTFPHVFFSKVPLPSIQEFAVVNSAFKKTPHYTTKSFSSRPKKLELRSQRKFNSIGFEHTCVAPLVENPQHLKVLAWSCLTNLALSIVPFSRLTELNVEDCAGLKYLFTSSTARRLVVLRNMSIINCESLEAVVMADDEEGEKKDEDVVFPNLFSLSLKKLPKLGSFDIVTNLAPSTVSFSRLTKLTVEDCARLKYLFTSSTVKRLVESEKMSITNCESLETVVVADDEDVVFPTLQKLDVRNCVELEEIVAKDDETATEEVSKKAAVFPKVTSLTLWDLPKLRCICSGMGILDWPMLQDLDVYHCQMLNIFATDCQNSPDVYLEGQDHFITNKHGIILANKVPPNLERLSLSKENVIMIEQGLVPHVDLLLQNIKFLTLQGFDKDSDAFPHVFFSKVQLPSIQEFAVVNSAFKKTPHYSTKSFSSRPKKLELRSQCKFNSIGFEHTWLAPLVENPQHLEVLAWSCLTNLALSIVSFSRLTELNVEDCAGLKCLFTSSTARSLVVLRNMSIINCESLEAVVMADDEEGEKKDEDVVFPNLFSLSLKKLPKLGSFDIVTNLAPSTVSFSRLTKLTVEDCARLKYLFTSSTVKRLVESEKMSITNCESLETVVVADDEDVVFPDLQKLDVRNCAELEEIVAEDDEPTTKEVSKKIAVFPKVTSLTLWDLPKLRCICSGMDTLDWAVLQDLDVYHCQMLKIFATDFQNSPDLYPEAQDHFTTYKHGIISADKVPPNLERLSLNKEDFILIEQGLLPHVNLQLQKIKFLRLQGFNDDSDVLLPELFLSKVSPPSIQEFGVADSAFKEIFPSQMPSMDFTTKSFSQLEKLELRSLYKLESIGFEHTWVAPLVGNLQDLKVLACTCLTNLAPSTVSFSYLIELNVEDCVGLKYLFTSSTARSLVVLGEMSIINCESLETVVVADDEEEDKKDEDVVFPDLFNLSLKNLPKLGSFYKGNSTLKFRNLFYVEITQCKSMKTFSHGDVEVHRIGDLEIDDDTNSAVRQQFEEAKKQP